MPETAPPEPDTELPALEFVAPMPGFPDHRRFVLVRLDDDGALYSMRSLDDKELRFLVAAPPLFFPDYAPEIDDEVLEQLKTDDPGRLLVLVVVTAAKPITDATANLLAPVIIDPLTRRAVQTVLTASELSVRAPLLPV